MYNDETKTFTTVLLSAVNSSSVYKCLMTCQNEESMWEFCKDVTYSWKSLTFLLFPTFFSFHSSSFSLPGTESCWREGTNSLAVREKSDKMKACVALLCRMTCCKNMIVFWKVTVEMASWEWVGEGYVYYLLMISRSSWLSLQV